jgi:hypothetical protein
LCLFYKGELSLDELMGDVTDNPAGASAAYGVASWHFSNGDIDRAREKFKALTSTSSWSSFGYIAAEVDLVSGNP